MAALEYLSGDHRTQPPKPAQLLPIALHAHREAQGGIGSGYDIATSLHGGVGLLVQGDDYTPSWSPLPSLRLPPLRWFRGAASVSTQAAITRYNDWQRRNRHQSRALLDSLNRAVAHISRCHKWHEALPSARLARAIGLELGAAIGVPAAIEIPGDIGSPVGPNASMPFLKAVGAGNELGVLFGAPSNASATASATTLPPLPGINPLTIEDDGIRWDYLPLP